MPVCRSKRTNKNEAIDKTLFKEKTKNLFEQQEGKDGEY